MFKKLLAMLLVAAMLTAGFAFAEEAAEEAEAVEETVEAEAEEVEEEYDPADDHSPVAILFTNDVHCGVEDGVGYAGVSGYEEAYWDIGYEVLLVDNGDAVDGGDIGTFSQGEYIVDIMNELDYDYAVPGDHEFDYGMNQFMELADLANFSYISANFLDANGEPVFDPYVIEDLGGWSVAFVGVTTPDVMTASPATFQDESGNDIYSFCQGNDGADLYAAVQSAVDSARDEGADYVILMSHLGNEDGGSPYTSGAVIANTTGIDAVLDGRTHEVVDGEVVQNADGEDVILASTGAKLENLGALTIAPDGTLGVEMHHEYTVLKDEYMVDYIDEIMADLENAMEEEADAGEEEADAVEEEAGAVEA